MQPTDLTAAAARMQQLDRIVDGRWASGERRTPSPGADRARPAPRRLPGALTIRPAVPADRSALERLAELDGRPRRWLPGRDLLVALDAAGRPVAAVDAGSPREGIADPFRPTAGALELLAARADQLSAGGAERPAWWLARLRPRQIP